ncbi:MAG TPA: hypothetical protein VL096_09340, partial [Pirellulaceae bacterium]|nr:hypothetical protein [Pirellulaceae bacterium]
MARLFARSSWSHLVPLAVLAILCTGCGDGQAPVTSASSQFKPADVNVAPGSGAATGTIQDTDTANTDQAQGAAGSVKQPAAIAVDKLDVESMPDGPPAKILAYMKQMERYEPRGVTRDQQRSDLIRVLHLVVEAGDRVLMHPEATEDERREGAGLKLGGLSKLAQLGEPKAELELIAFATRLKKDKSPGVARVGRLVLFSIDAAKLQNGEVEDPELILNELQSLLEGDDEEHVVFEIGKQTAIVLVQIGQNKAAGRVFKMLGTKYANDPKPEIANEAKQLLKQVKLVELDFPKKFNDLFGDDAKPDAANELLAVIKILLDDPARDASELTVAAMTADRLERTDHYGPAGEV